MQIRTCKLCSDGEGIVVGGEYGMTAAMLKEGYNVATFMTKYAKVRQTAAYGSCMARLMYSRSSSRGYGRVLGGLRTQLQGADELVAPALRCYNQWLGRG